MISKVTNIKYYGEVFIMDIQGIVDALTRFNLASAIEIKNAFVEKAEENVLDLQEGTLPLERVLCSLYGLETMSQEELVEVAKQACADLNMDEDGVPRLTEEQKEKFIQYVIEPHLVMKDVPNISLDKNKFAQRMRSIKNAKNEEES